MTYSDDSLTPPTAPFSGDDTGQFGETPDMVRESPTTNERVVDTQSGFLVIVRRMNNKISLSVKRRIGTPPTSGIYLTPDESLKLSGILADQVSGQTGQPANARKIEGSVSSWLNSLGASSTAEARLNARSQEIERNEEEIEDDAIDLNIDERAFHREARARKAARTQTNRATKMAVILCGLILVVFVSGGIFSLFNHKKKEAPAPVAAVPVQEDATPLSDASVDKFARTFISDMLDFDPDTYKVSQIQAMSHMTPPVLEKYWQETSFPLSKKQLKSSPQGQTVMITKVSQERTGTDKKEVDIFAELVSANSKISTPVHLKLGLSASADKELKVENLQDLTTKK